MLTSVDLNMPVAQKGNATTSGWSTKPSNLESCFVIFWNILDDTPGFKKTFHLFLGQRPDVRSIEPPCLLLNPRLGPCCFHFWSTLQTHTTQNCTVIIEHLISVVPNIWPKPRFSTAILGFLGYPPTHLAGPSRAAQGRGPRSRSGGADLKAGKAGKTTWKMPKIMGYNENRDLPTKNWEFHGGFMGISLKWIGVWGADQESS